VVIQSVSNLALGVIFLAGAVHLLRYESITLTHASNVISRKLLDQSCLNNYGTLTRILKTITRVNYDGIQWLLVFQDEYNTMMQYMQQVTTERNTTLNDSIFYGLSTERSTSADSRTRSSVQMSTLQLDEEVNLIMSPPIFPRPVNSVPEETSM
ncbi:hypothetical protein E4U40_007629, partial [Claviceps sp. LM458 group G5]